MIPGVNLGSESIIFKARDFRGNTIPKTRRHSRVKFIYSLTISAANLDVFLAKK